MFQRGPYRWKALSRLLQRLDFASKAPGLEYLSADTGIGGLVASCSRPVFSSTVTSSVKVMYRRGIFDHSPGQLIGPHGPLIAMLASFHRRAVLVLHERANLRCFLCARKYWFSRVKKVEKQHTKLVCRRSCESSVILFGRAFFLGPLLAANGGCTSRGVSILDWESRCSAVGSVTRRVNIGVHEARYSLTERLNGLLEESSAQALTNTQVNMQAGLMRAPHYH